MSHWGSWTLKGYIKDCQKPSLWILWLTSENSIKNWATKYWVLVVHTEIKLKWTSGLVSVCSTDSVWRSGLHILHTSATQYHWFCLTVWSVHISHSISFILSNGLVYAYQPLNIIDSVWWSGLHILHTSSTQYHWFCLTVWVYAHQPPNIIHSVWRSGLHISTQYHWFCLTVWSTHIIDSISLIVSHGLVYTSY